MFRQNTLLKAAVRGISRRRRRWVAEKRGAEAPRLGSLVWRSALSTSTSSPATTSSGGELAKNKDDKGEEKVEASDAPAERSRVAEPGEKEEMDKLGEVPLWQSWDEPRTNFVSGWTRKDVGGSLRDS